MMKKHFFALITILLIFLSNNAITKKNIEIKWTQSLSTGDIYFSADDNYFYNISTNIIQKILVEDGTVVKILKGYLAGTVSASKNELIALSAVLDSVFIDTYNAETFEKTDSIHLLNMHSDQVFSIVVNSDVSKIAYSNGYELFVIDKYKKIKLIEINIGLYNSIRPIAFSKDGKNLFYKINWSNGDASINKINKFSFEDNKSYDFLNKTSNLLINKEKDKYMCLIDGDNYFPCKYLIKDLSSNVSYDTISLSSTMSLSYFGSEKIVFTSFNNQSKNYYCFVDASDLALTELIEIPVNLVGFNLRFSNKEDCFIANRTYPPSNNYSLVKLHEVNDIIEIEKGEELHIFPNPVSTCFSISHPPEDGYNFEIYDCFGIKQCEGKVERKNNIEYLPSGVYYLKLNNKSKPIKFVKL